MISPARQAILEEQGFIARSTHPNSNPFVAGIIRIFLWATGLGHWQGRLLFVIAGGLSCVAMMLILCRDQHSPTALCGGMLLATNYVFFQYNRLALEENLVNLFGLFSFACLRTLNLRLSFLSGLLAGVMVFLIKLHGLVYVAAMALALWSCWFSLPQVRSSLVKIAFAWLAGFALLSVVGTLFKIKPAYAPLGQYFVGALDEEPTSPIVTYLLETPSRTLSVGAKSDLFVRMPATFLLAWVFLLSLIGRSETDSSKKNSVEKEPAFISSELILACMVTATFAGLSLLRYRPLRYEALLIPSLTGLSALLVGRLLAGTDKGAETKQLITDPIGGGYMLCLRCLRAAVLFYMIHLVLTVLTGLIFAGPDASVTTPARLTFTLLLWLTVLQFWQPLSLAASRAFAKPRVARAVAVVSLLALAGIQGWQSVHYFRSASVNTISSSRNVAPLFPSGFLITGEFADALSVETKYASHPYSSLNPSIHEALEQSPNTDGLLVSALERDGKWVFHLGGVSEEIRKGNWMPILAQSLGPVSEESRIVQVLIARAATGHYPLAMSCLLTGDERSARHHLRKFLEIHPNHIPALLYTVALDSKWKEIPPSETEAFLQAERIIQSGVPVNDWDRHHFEALMKGTLEILRLTESLAPGLSLGLAGYLRSDGA
jgi:hypothetical protein